MVIVVVHQKLNPKSSLDKMNRTHYGTKILTDANDKDGAGYIMMLGHVSKYAIIFCSMQETILAWPVCSLILRVPCT